MGPLIARFGGMLLNVAGSIAGQVLIALGIGVVTYTGVDVTLGWLKGMAVSSLTGLPAEAVSLISFLKVGVCINIITSAYVARLTLEGFTNGTFKKWVIK